MVHVVKNDWIVLLAIFRSFQILDLEAYLYVYINVSFFIFLSPILLHMHWIIIIITLWLDIKYGTMLWKELGKSPS